MAIVFFSLLLLWVSIQKETVLSGKNNCQTPDEKIFFPILQQQYIGMCEIAVKQM